MPSLPRDFGRCFVILTSLLLGATEVATADTPKLDFSRDVLPLLKQRCFECHAGTEASSGYRLDTRREILGETTGYPLVVVGKSAASVLIQRVLSTNPKKRMPPEGPALTETEVATLRRWIDEGVHWPESQTEANPAATHWAFQPISQAAIPVLMDRSNVRTPVDSFIQAEQAKRGLQPAKEAGRRVLIRRLSLDLLGLPPTAAEIDSFVSDTRPDAYERLVERYLMSPHYGERWGRHWLDIARWAETEGYESNHPRVFAWRYRDYVIDSFNRDKPYDRFITEQIAGDELLPLKDEHLIATGFLASARLSSNEEDKWLQRNQVLVDVVNATGSAFLGLSISCAQCHNHKFDPITLKDYYRLMAYFLPGQPVNVELQDAGLWETYHATRDPDYEATVKQRNQIIASARQKYDEEVRRQLTPDQCRILDLPPSKRTITEELEARKLDLKFQATLAELEKRIPAADRPSYDGLKKKLTEMEKRAVPPQTWAYFSPVQSPHRVNILPSIGFYPLPYEPEQFKQRFCYVHLRGEVHGIGPRVTPGIPEIFASSVATQKTGGKRSDLAAWITDPANPLTARVWANRVWQYHFGKGLVPSASDFGIRGDKPTHPALLDWLAQELIRSGWSTKHLHRLMVRSHTYRQAAEVTEEARRADPENRYLTRWPIRRLEAEAIRDTMLRCTDELDVRLGGMSEPAEQADRSLRRSLYLFHKRGRPVEMQGLFDGPNEAAESCPKRHTSTTALQSLYLLNHPFTLARATRLASLLPVGQTEAIRRLQIEEGFRRVLGRPPEAKEMALSLRFLAAGTEDAASEDKVLIRFCQALLNLNEVVYLE